MKVFICRHGETEWNLLGKLQGVADSVLTKKGVRQAEQTAKTLANTKPVAIYTSDLKRAVATAEIIARPHNLKPIPVHELHEINAGKFEGHTKEESDKLFPKENAEWALDKFNNLFPGGESNAQVVERLKPFAEKIKREHANDEIILVMHRSSGRAMATILAGIPGEKMINFEFLHDIIYKIELNGKPKVSMIRNGKTTGGLFYPEK